MNPATEDGNAGRGGARAARAHTSRGVLLAWFAAAWLCLLLWQVYAHSATAVRQRRIMANRGHASLDVLEAAIRSIGRRRREQPDFLGRFLAEVLAIPAVKGALLIEPDGTVLARTGAVDALLEDPLKHPDTWFNDTLIVSREINISAVSFGTHMGLDAEPHDPVPRRAFPPHPARLSLLLDAQETSRQIANDRSLRASIVLAGGVALLGLALFVNTRLRTRALRMELAVAEERSRRHREWALLGAGLAHETKNPISVVRGLAQHLAAQGGEDSRRQAGKIVEEIDRVVTRIDEFLQFARPIAPHPAPVALAPLFADMAQFIEGDLSPQGAAVTTDAQELVVDADHDMLRQILLNLLINAAQALESGGAIALRAFPQDSGEAAIEVRDDGKGIPAGEIDRVFEPYYTRTAGGAGLGLAVVKRLVEAHGWQIRITSEPGCGTTVRITGMRRHADGEGHRNDSLRG